jgi:phosphate transport system substrate-binding protein
MTTKRTTTNRKLALVSVAIVAGLVSAACGSSSKKTATSSSSSTGPTTTVACAPGTVSGAGSSFVATIVQQWIKDFDNACSGATVNYQSVGSGAGIQQFTAGTVDFGASDVPMKATEQTAAEAKNGPVLHIPWSAGGIAVEYNVSGVSNLQLDANTLASIFAGKIKKWDDPAIKATNSGATLPSEGIQVVHRSDGSGTTAAFTAYLTAVAPGVWTFGSAKDVPWPTGQGAKGSDGVTAAVKQTEGAIGYAEVSYAKQSSLNMAKIKNSAGNFTAPDANAVSAALASATVPANLKVSINYAPTDPVAYPITTDTFALVPQKPADPAKGKLLKDFILYALGAGQQAAPGLDYAPLPPAILGPAMTAAQSIQA